MRYILIVFLSACVSLCGGLAIHAQEAPAIDLDALPPCNFSSNVEVSNLRLGAVVLHLETGDGCADNLDETFPVASVPKLFVLGAYLEEVALGWRDFNDTVTFSSDYVMGGPQDCLSYDDVGFDVSYGYLADIMISCSDNSATWMLMDLLRWETVADYIDRLGIDGIGPVIPYAEVDRLKLSFLNPAWEDVPMALASQHYRNRRTEGLVPDYFSSDPAYSRSERRDANAQYFETYDYNTMTPRAMAEYLLHMRQQLDSTDFAEGLAAWWFFERMMLTQRQFSTQDLPPTVYVGAKNGFDVGLKAEASAGFRDLISNKPESLVIVFTHQTDLRAADVSLPRRETDLLNRYLASISPQISSILYPDEPELELSIRSNIVSVTFSHEDNIETCREETTGGTRSAYLRELATCWRNLTSITRLPVNERLGLGIVLRDLGNQEARLTMVFHAPDGRQFAYQYNTRFVEEDNVFWYHRLDMRGTWRIDIFQDLELVYSELIEAV